MPNVNAPLVVVIAGPNGAGKSTTAPRLLQEALAVTEFVNADAIALGLSAFRPEGAALPAARAMLSRIKALARARDTFSWQLLDNAEGGNPLEIASRRVGQPAQVFDEAAWDNLLERQG